MSPQGSDERSHIREHKPPDWPSPRQQPANRLGRKRTVFEAAGRQKTVTTPENTWSFTKTNFPSVNTSTAVKLLDCDDGVQRL